jgi:hypothetical protein
LIVITPPLFDDQRAQKDFSYNAVLDHYADWLLSQREHGWQVIDLHGPMTAEVARRRETDPEFTFQRDAVHPGPEGHWFMAAQLIRWFGDAKSADAESPEAMLEAKSINPKVMELVQEKMTVLRNAYVSGAGHKRPGVRAGLPVDQAEEKAKELTSQIAELAR